jgi:AcrR family transcriptional regulator
MALSETAARTLRADARRNRQRVLDAARGCFATAGRDAQMDDIAAAAGVGVGTVYRHFATKDVLMEALAADYFAGQTAIAREASEIEDPWDAFVLLMRNGAALMAQSRALSQLSADRADLMLNAALEADREAGFFGLLDRIIGRAQRAGELREDFQLEDIPAIMCSIGGLLMSKGPHANWERVLEILIDGLRAPAGHELPPVQNRIPRRQ